MGCSHDSFFNGKYNEHSEKEQVTDGSGPFINPHFPDYQGEFEKYKNNTWVDVLNETFVKHKNKNIFGFRRALSDTQVDEKHTYITFGEVSNYANILAKNIRDLNLAPLNDHGEEGKVSCVGLFARNCTEWFITDLACQRDSVTSVTFYSTLGDQSFDHIFEQTQCSTIFISNDCLDNFIKYYKKYKFSSLKTVVLFDLTLFSNDEMFNKLKELKSFEVLSFKNDLLKDVGSKTELKISTPNTLFTICYTSGTTNLPKGAKITQNNFFAGQFSVTESGIKIHDESVHLSYLPLAHIMERVGLHLMVGNGALSCFVGGDVKTYLAKDIALSRPTLLIAVPRVLTMFQQTITKAFSELTGCKRNLVEKGIAAKRENFAKNGSLEHSLYDKLVFKKIREKFGGRIEAFITGSAPLSLEVANDIKIFFSAPIIEAYGMTEISGALVVTSVNDNSNISAGGVLRINQFKLADRKEMNYHSKTLLDGEPSPTGEICCKGLNIFKGYFLDKKNTQEAFDSEGWLRTGDVGRLLPNNKGLKIIDRVKEIFKLSQGEYIAPSKLENAYIKSKYIMQICIHGDSLHSYLLAIIVPNRVEIEKYLKESGIMKDGEDVENFFDNKQLNDEIRKDFDSIAKVNSFNSLEKIQKFIISKVEFNVGNEMTTPTMKVVRKKVEQYFSEEIKKCYV